MKLLTIIIKDTGFDNHQLLLTIKENYQYYPELASQIDLIYITEKEIAIEQIKTAQHLNEVELNSKYSMFMNDNDNFKITLSDLCKLLEVKEADLIISSLGEADHRMNQLIATENYEEYLQVSCNRLIWGTIFKNQFISDKQIKIKPKISADGIKIIYDIIKYAPVVDYIPKPFYQIQTDKWWSDNNSTEALFKVYDQMFFDLGTNVTNPVAPYTFRAMLKRIKRQNLEQLKGWKQLKRKHKNVYQILFKKMSLADQLYFQTPVTFKNNINITNYADDLIYKVTNKHDFKTKKIVIIDPNGEYQNEVKYLVKKIHRTTALKEYQIFCIGKGVNKQITYLQKQSKIKYHLLTASEIIGFDFKYLLHNKRKDQEYTQIITKLNKNNELLEETKNLLVNEKATVRNLITSVWLESTESNHLLNDFIKDVTIVNEALPSTRWLKKNQYNSPLYDAIFKKYRLSNEQQYIIYIPQKVNHKVFIDVEKLLLQIDENQNLVIYLPEKIDYELVNFQQKPYYLFTSSENLIELLLIMNSIITDYGNYQSVFHQLNRPVNN